MNFDNSFDSPTPGQSLTLPKGATKMERPPQFVHVNDFAEYLWDKMTGKKQVAQIEVALRKDATITELAFTVLQEAVTQGIVNVDVALQSMNIVCWIVESIAKLRGVKYKFKEEDPELLDLLRENANVFRPKAVEQVRETEEVIGNPFSGLTR